jgi:hypothetical protein
MKRRRRRRRSTGRRGYSWWERCSPPTTKRLGTAAGVEMLAMMGSTTAAGRELKCTFPEKKEHLKINGTKIQGMQVVPFHHTHICTYIHTFTTLPPPSAIRSFA